MFHRLLFASTLVLFSSVVQAHISFADDYECSGSYDRDCFVMPESRKIARLSFEGTAGEMGVDCSAQTLRLHGQIASSAALLGINSSDFSLSSPRVDFSGGTGRKTSVRCRYILKSNRQDLRFVLRRHDRRFWEKDPKNSAACRADVRAAESIPGSIGAALSVTFALLQGEMCESYYLLPGLDRISVRPDGSTQIDKFDGN